jgi:hypothetical protein
MGRTIEWIGWQTDGLPRVWELGDSWSQRRSRRLQMDPNMRGVEVRRGDRVERRSGRRVLDRVTLSDTDNSPERAAGKRSGGEHMIR